MRIDPDYNRYYVYTALFYKGVQTPLAVPVPLSGKKMERPIKRC